MANLKRYAQVHRNWTARLFDCHFPRDTEQSFISDHITSKILTFSDRIHCNACGCSKLIHSNWAAQPFDCHFTREILNNVSSQIKSPQKCPHCLTEFVAMFVCVSKQKMSHCPTWNSLV